MQVTLEIPDQLARRLEPELRELPEIIASGLRVREWAGASELTNEALAFLAKGPSPEEILRFRPSTSLVERSRELLEKNRANALTADEGAELDEMGLMDQLVTLLKAKAHRHAGGKRVSQADSGELRRLIASRAYDRCEYCKTPNAAALWPHEPDHIIAEQHGGATSPENLALACFQGNRLKGPNIASVDPQTGAVTRLYHPRSDTWSDRFRLEASRIVPLTAPGRATASLLRLNSPERLVVRSALLEARTFPT